ncbi:MAG: sulfopyruvate decarboxylase subunit alpha [Parasphingorhabdus sp.]|jgi:sulfopyruvate decarboxylase subunit alpha
MSDSDNLAGASIINSFKRAGVKSIVAVPDIVTCDHMLWPISKDKELQLVMVCKEDEGVSICSGMSYADHRAILLIQHTGFLDSVNAIRAMGMDYQLPVVMAVGLQGMEADKLPSESKHNGLRILEPILQAMNISYNLLVHDSDTTSISESIDQAYSTPRPHVFLIVRSPV